MIKRAFVASLLWVGAATAGASLPLASARHLSFETAEGTWMAPDVSPDGKSIVFDLLGDIYSIGSAGGQARPIMTGAAFDANPVFSPDGKQLAFISDRSGANNLWVASADGSNPRQISQARWRCRSRCFRQVHRAGVRRYACALGRDPA